MPGAGFVAGALLAVVAAAAGPPAAGFLALSEDGRSIHRLAPPGSVAGNLLAEDYPLYQIQVLDEAAKKVTFTSHQAASVHSKSFAGGVKVRFLPSAAHPATVECTFLERGDGVEASIAVEPVAGFTLTQVEFPMLMMKLPLGDTGADDELVLPFSDGSVLRDPAQSLKPGNAWSAHYPGSLAAQFIALLDPEAGLYVACEDGEGHIKQMSFRRFAQGLRLEAVHLMPLRPSKAWQLPYRVVLRPCRGDWKQAADLYKQWAVKQRWCARKLVERSDVPAWVKQGPFFHAVSMRARPDGKTQVNFLGQLPEYIHSYHQALDWPVCAMIMGWEKHGAWITPDYFPPYGGEKAFRQATAAVLGQGDYTLVFLSGLKWTLERSREDFNGWEEFERRAQEWATVGEDGEVLIRGKPDAGVGRYAQICPATEPARKMLADSTRQCVRMGVLGVQVDQVVGGAAPACYSRDHGHPAGPGKWLSEAVYQAFEAAVRTGKRENPSYAFAIEEPNELFLPLLDCYHARDYQFGRWPRGGPGQPYPVPLFAYLYHEYALGYGGDSASLIHWPSAYLTLAQVLNAVTGKTPGGCVWGRPLPPEEVHPSILGVTRQHCRLLKAGAGKWLLMGRMLDFDFVEGPSFEVKAASHSFTFHAVQSSAWAAADGTLAWLLANATGEERQVEVTLDDQGVLAGKKVKLTTISGEDGKRHRQPGTHRLPTTVPLTLKPYSMVLLAAD